MKTDQNQELKKQKLKPKTSAKYFRLTKFGASLLLKCFRTRTVIQIQVIRHDNGPIYN